MNQNKTKIKAVIFDMFETLITLFEGKTYFSENIAQDLGVFLEEFRKHWHATEKERTLGKYTMAEGVGISLKNLGAYSEENVRLVVEKRRAALQDTFNAIPEASIRLLQSLHEHGILVGLITNTFSDECEMIKACPLFPLFDVAMISYEQGLCKPDPEIYKRMITKLGVKPEECLYVGDGGSRELYGARDAGMQAVQCTWFHERAFEPHIPCPLLDDFPHADTQEDILKYIEQ